MPQPEEIRTIEADEIPQFFKSFGLGFKLVMIIYYTLIGGCISKEQHRP